MAFNKLMIMLPLMFAARKLDGEDPNVVFMLRCSYFTVQFFISLAVIYIFLVSKKLAGSKFKDTVIYVPPPPQPLADPNAKPQYKQSTFGEQATKTATSLLTSTFFWNLFDDRVALLQGDDCGTCHAECHGTIESF
jgi:Phosphate transporter (Pho88).